jgi:hypothetical protein
MSVTDRETHTHREREWPYMILFLVGILYKILIFHNYT